MFEAIKLYVNEKLDIRSLFEGLVGYGYERVGRVSDEGDFDMRGGAISIFPVTFTDPIRLELSDDIIGRIRSYDAADGTPLEDHAIVIILPVRGIFKKKLRTRVARITDRSPIESFVDIEPGDRVVHVDHGIGLYRGVEKHRVDRRLVDHVVLEYAGADRLHIPFGEIHLIQKYVGFEKRPRLHRLGSKEWMRTRARAQRGINNLALELLETAAKREMAEGHAFSPDTDWQARLEASFPFDETPDQTRVTLEVKRDMESPKPMDRLICGDVGYGKTEIALRAAFKAVMDNKQVAILVPTTLLAEQHWATFRQRMNDFPVRVEMISRFRNRHEQASIVRDLAEKKIDIIIGTHRLLSKDVILENLGLIIIDEEQRFGVRHKEKLKCVRTLADVLTMTATPIPRTLYLSLMNARDMSLLETPPQSRLPIKTVVSGYEESIIKKAVDFELARKGQVYFVTSRILGIEKIAGMLKRLCPGARVAVGHGSVSPRALESTMKDFIGGDIDILVSTTIIESGIDIPNANTLIVNNAEQFGLADLYQLRGRVGRFNRQAFAYLLASRGAVLKGGAWSRLSAINNHTELGSGFRIAMKDLEIRGAGNILGPEQHGYINTLGFDLYCRMLRSAVDSYKKSLSLPT